LSIQEKDSDSLRKNAGSLFQNNKLIQCYIRIAKPLEFRCNEHKGGRLVYITKNQIPSPVREIAKKIATKIDKPKSLYALDFVISNRGRVYFIEGNSGPGLDWDVTKKENEKMSKRLIRSIVEELLVRTGEV